MKYIILILLVIVGLLVIFDSGESSNYMASNAPTPIVDPTPTVDPNPTWHTVYEFSGGNGDTTTDQFNIKGNKWRIDYITQYDLYEVFINVQNNNGIDLPEVYVIGASNNSKTIYDLPPGTYNLSISSAGQNYSLQVEDYY